MNADEPDQEPTVQPVPGDDVIVSPPRPPRRPMARWKKITIVAVGVPVLGLSVMFWVTLAEVMSNPAAFSTHAAAPTSTPAPVTSMTAPPTMTTVTSSSTAPTTPPSTTTVAPTTTAETTATRSADAVLLASAGPLHAHIGGPDGNSVLCDADTATAEPDGHGGVRVVVNFPGPALLQSSILATDGHSQDLNDTVSSQESGFVFGFAGFDLSRLQVLDVYASAQGTSGTCDVVDNMN